MVLLSVRILEGDFHRYVIHSTCVKCEGMGCSCATAELTMSEPSSIIVGMKKTMAERQKEYIDKLVEENIALRYQIAELKSQLNKSNNA